MSNVLALDIETSPAKVYTFTLWPKFIGIDSVIQDVQILRWSAKWVGEDYIYSDALIHHHKWKSSEKLPSDKRLIENLEPLLAEADAVVAHNGRSFDMSIIRARAIIHNMSPLPPVKVIDTLMHSRRIQKLLSHKLDFLSQVYNIGKKLEHEGIPLWIKCMEGDKDAWNRMKEYNDQDVYLLEDVYLRLLPHMTGHPNFFLGTSEDTRPMCRACGYVGLHRRGTTSTNLGKYQRYVCPNCGKWSKGRVNLLSKETRESITMDIIT